MVPPPPLFGAPGEDKPKIRVSVSKAQSPFDAAFLRRVYRAMLLFGALLALLTAFGSHSATATGSFIGGMILAALLLRSQEIAVRGMLRPVAEMGGFDAKMMMLLALPLKFLGIGVALWIANAQGWLQVAPFAVGFFAGQLVLLSQVAGWLLKRVLSRGDSLSKAAKQ